MSARQPPAGQQRPRLTMRGAFVLAAVFLTIGPTVSFALGIPANLVERYVVSLASGVGLDEWGPNGYFFWTNLLLSPASMVLGLPFFGWWADLHLVHVAGWIACAVILLATSRRGFRVRDTAVIAAGAVLAFPFLMESDSPALTWGYPDAFFMAISAAGGAAACAAVVRGLSTSGLRRRIAWGWLV